MPFRGNRNGDLIKLLNFHVMARKSSGILGDFTGRIGSVTGFMRNGHNLLRSGSCPRPLKGGNNAVLNQRVF